MDSSTLGFVGVAIILALIILNEVWNIRFEGMRDQIRELSKRVDRLEWEQARMRGTIEGMREGRLTRVKPEGRFRG